MAENDELKRYLQQLQEMGESELTLNSASAARAFIAARTLSTGGSSTSSIQSSPAKPTAAAPAPEAIADARDWRAALLAASGDAAAPPQKPAKTAARATTASSVIPAEREPSVVSPHTMTASSVIPAQRESSVVSPGEAQPKTVVPRYSLPAPTENPAEKGSSRPVAPLTPGLEVHAVVNDIFAAASAFESLETLAAAVATCRRCALHSSAKNPVPGEGSATAELVCVGEGPGASEDETGRPFVGAAGKLLTSILGAIKLQREDVYICNVVKHRPPANRTPLPDEIAACQPYLVRQLELIRPKVILALGTVAAQTLLGTKLTIGKLRGSVHRYHGIPLIVTYHPAALLRNPAWKRPTWEDVQHVRRILDDTRGA